MRRALYWLTVVIAVAALAGGAVYAYLGYRDTAGPDGTVKGYFAALARSDAPAALGFGRVPAGPRDLLTSQVLAEQQQIAPLRDVQIQSVARSGSRATVRYSYQLRFRTGSRTVTGAVQVIDGAAGWRMTQTAVATTVKLDQATDRSTFAEAAVPEGRTLLFPGALPIRFDTPYLALTPRAAQVRFGGRRTTTLGVRATPAARLRLTAALHKRLTACVSGPPPTARLPAAVRPIRPGQPARPPRRRVVAPDQVQRLVRCCRLDRGEGQRGVSRPVPPADLRQHHPVTSRRGAPAGTGVGLCRCAARVASGRDVVKRALAAILLARNRPRASCGSDPGRPVRAAVLLRHVARDPALAGGRPRPRHHDRRDRHRRRRRPGCLPRPGAVRNRLRPARRRRTRRPRQELRTGTARRWPRSWSAARASSASRAWRRAPRCCRWPSRWRGRPTRPTTTGWPSRSGGRPTTARRSSACRWAACAGRPATRRRVRTTSSRRSTTRCARAPSCSPPAATAATRTTRSRNPACASASCRSVRSTRPDRWRRSPRGRTT